MSVCVASTILPNYVIETAHYFSYEHTGVFLKTWPRHEYTREHLAIESPVLRPGVHKGQKVLVTIGCGSQTAPNPGFCARDGGVRSYFRTLAEICLRSRGLAQITLPKKLERATVMAFWKCLLFI